MPLENDTAWNLSNGGTTSLVTPSTALLNRKLAIWKSPRMLKPSEIDLLRRSKKEMAEAITAVLAIEDERQSDSRQAAAFGQTSFNGNGSALSFANLCQSSVGANLTLLVPSTDDPGAARTEAKCAKPTVRSELRPIGVTQTDAMKSCVGDSPSGWNERV